MNNHRVAHSAVIFFFAFLAAVTCVAQEMALLSGVRTPLSLLTHGSLTAETPPPEFWQFPDGPRRIHIARGLWWQHWRLHEAGGSMGGAFYSDSYDVYGGTNYHGFGKTLGDFPRTVQELESLHTIVITGVRASALPLQTQKLLVAWVRGGGGLLVTGGVHGFGEGAYKDTPLAGVLPVEVSSEKDLTNAPAGFLLVPSEAGKRVWGDTLPWAQRPRGYWYHAGLTPKEGTEVLLAHGKEPLVTRWTVGKGRVVAIGLTVCGEAVPGACAFWDWGGWPQAMAKLLAWLGETPDTRRANAELPISAELQRELESLRESSLDELEESAEVDGEMTPPVDTKKIRRFLALARQGRGDAFSAKVMTAFVESGGACTVDQADRFFSLMPQDFPVQMAAVLGNRLLLGRSVGRAALGLRLLGISDDAQGTEILLRFFAKGESAFPREEMLGGPEIGSEDLRLRRAAVRAIADRADPAMLESFLKQRAAFLKSPPSSPLVAQLVEELRQEMDIALCMMGDASAAMRMLDTLIQNRLDVEAETDFLEVRAHYESKDARKIRMKKHKLAREHIQSLFRRNRQLEQALARFPEKALPKVAAAVSRWTGEFATIYLQACLVRRNAGAMTPAARDAFVEILKTTKLPAIRNLCLSHLAEGDAAALAPVFDIWLGGTDADALYACSMLFVLPAQTRAVLVKKGLSHPSAAVRAAALRCLPLVSDAERKGLQPVVDDVRDATPLLKAVYADITKP